ncbi:MAG: DUF4352 domain-containing protein [Chloroflexi bacterium]|nr:DUF4352 domain-containing protein [Chloroflexota bacterium]
MKKILALLLCSLLGSFTLASCNSTGGTVLPVSSPTPQATAVTKSLPEPISMGQTITYKDLQVTMDQSEVTASYITEYGSSRDPSADSKFLWVHIILKNISQQEQDLPAVEHFSALFDTTEFKPSYGHRKDHTDYTSLNTVINQGEEMDAWLRFDVPANAELKDLTFAFLPESTQISFGFSSNDYSWADHPIFLWMCAP